MGETGTSRWRAVIAEDEAIVALDLKERLNRFGYEVVATVPSAERAVAAVTELLPDIVLMDIRLQGKMDGIDAAMQIHEKLDIPIVFLSAFSDEATLKRLMADEPSGYLLKPIDEHELEVVVSAAIRRAQAIGHFRRSEEWLASVLRGISDAVIATVDGAVRYLNPAAEHLTGWTMREAIGMDVARVVRTSAGPSSPDPTAPRVIGGKLIARDGTERSIEGNITSLRDGESPAAEVWLFRDITERRRTEEALRESQERFRLLIDGVKDYAIYMLDQDGRIVSWNQGAERIYGCRDEDVLGKLYSVFCEEAPETLADALEAAVAMGRFEETGWRLRSDGSRFLADMVITPLLDPMGTLRGYAKVTRDITERWRAEVALRDSEERLRLALGSAGLGAWDYYPATGKIIVDGRCKALWGLRADAEASRDAFFAGVHEDDRARVLKAVEHALTPGSGGDYAIEYRTVGATNGIERWVDAQGKVFFSKKKRPTRFLGTVRDVTEHHRLEELHDQLTGVFAHDLRTPLAATLMAIQILLGRPFEAEQEKMLRVIARSAGRMERMIQQLMDFTRVRFGGGMPLALERVDLAALCRDAVREVEVAYPGRTVRCEMPAECVGTWDRTSLGRLLSNLLGNALQHGLSSKSPSLILRADGTEVVLQVHNEGTPIPKDDLPVIFDPFRRDRRRAQRVASMGQGLGLGLFITREIVTAHGGRIEVRSGNEGTTFVVRLPRERRT